MAILKTVEFTVSTIQRENGVIIEIGTRIQRNGVFHIVQYDYTPSDKMLQSNSQQSWVMREGMTVGEILDYIMCMHGVGPGAVTMTPYVPTAVEVPTPPYRTAA